MTAVDDVSFTVPQGSVLGLLGPNGAGKTTTVRMMTTLSRPTSGTARVAGHDVVREPEAVRRSMGLTGQAATVDELLTGRENLRLMGSLYGLSKADDPPALRRAPRALLAHRCRQQGRQGLQRWHAPPPRPRGQPHRHPARALPRRAHDGARPAQPRRAVGGPARARPRRHDAAADDPVPRGGRPARRPHRRHRPRPHHRPGHTPRAQGPVRQGGDRAHGVARRPARGRPGTARLARPRGARRRGRAAADRAGRRAVRHDACRDGLRAQRDRARRPGSASGRASTTSSSASPATAPSSRPAATPMRPPQPSTPMEEQR